MNLRGLTLIYFRLNCVTASHCRSRFAGLLCASIYLGTVFGGELCGAHILDGIKCMQIKETFLSSISIRNAWYYMRCLCFATIIGCVLTLSAQATEPTPTISPNYAVFSSGPQTVTITSTDGTANYYYTLDGTDPTTSSTHYVGGFTISVSKTVKAIGVGTGGTSSIARSDISIDSNTSNVARTGLQLWLKSDNGVITTGSNVNTWHDVSGNSMDASESTSINQPTINNSAISGLPAVNFSGSAQYLQFPSGFANFTSGVTIIVVGKATGWTRDEARVLEFSPAGGINNDFLLDEPTSSSLAFYTANSSGTVTEVTANNSLLMNNYQVMEATHNGTATGTLYANGVQYAQNTSMSALGNVSRTSNYIGRSGLVDGYYYQGEIAEVFLWNRALNSTELASMHAYLKSRYTFPQPVTITNNQRVFATSPQNVTMTAVPSLANIYLTSNGTTPTTASTLYNPASPPSISVTPANPYKAIADTPVSTGAVATAYLQIDANTANVLNIANKMLWLKADNGVTSVSSNVSNWQDNSGNLSDAAQATGTNQPTVVASAINGLPAINFNGTSQYFQMPAGLANFSAGATGFLIAQPAASFTSARTFFDIGNSASDDIALAQTTSTALQLTAYNGPSASTVSSPSAISSGYQMFEFTHNGPTGANGQPANSANIMTQGIRNWLGPVNSLNNITRSANFIGQKYNATNLFSGKIAEMLLFSSPLSNADRVSVEWYLTNRYGLTPPPPSITPGTSVNDYFVPSGGLRPGVRIANGAVTGATGTTTYFTTDGTTPSPSSPAYSGEFFLTSSSIVQAMSTENSVSGSVASSYLQLDPSAEGVPRAGLQLWLKGDYGVVASGSSVLQWTDMSGSGNDAVQPTGANQPALVPNGQNALPSLSFNGSSQYLKLPPFFSYFNAGATIMAVTKPTTLTTGATMLDAGNGAASDNISLVEQNTSGTLRLHVYSGATDSTLDAPSALTAGQYMLQEMTHNGSGTATIFQNGTQLASGTVNNITSVTRASSFIGQASAGGSFFPGNFAEVLLWNRPLTTSERLAAESYLLQRYQLLSITPAAPVLSPATLAGPGQVTITAPIGTTVFVTTDGTTPTTSSSVYLSPINVMYSQTIKSIAVKNGIQSGVSSMTYTLDSTKWPAPSSDSTPLNFNLQLPTTASPQ